MYFNLIGICFAFQVFVFITRSCNDKLFRSKLVRLITEKEVSGKALGQCVLRTREMCKNTEEYM
jgi:hypothetical protein